MLKFWLQPNYKHCLENLCCSITQKALRGRRPCLSMREGRSASLGLIQSLQLSKNSSSSFQTGLNCQSREISCILIYINDYRKYALGALIGWGTAVTSCSLAEFWRSVGLCFYRSCISVEGVFLQHRH